MLSRVILRVREDDETWSAQEIDSDRIEGGYRWTGHVARLRETINAYILLLLDEKIYRREATCETEA